MQIISFVEQIDEVRRSAYVYIRETIKREGEVKIITDYDVEEDERKLVVPICDSFNGEMKNINVATIKEDSIVGYDDDGYDGTFPSSEWMDGTAEYIADYVARYYGELK